MSWQDWLGQNLPPGTRETSGYRTPAQQRVLGGPSSSYHSRGTVVAPGAIDIGGPADKLKQLFDEIKQAFAGRINELYLNIPGGRSEAIKNNQPLGSNPEAGRPQHLHVSIGDGGPPQSAFEKAVDRVLKGIPTPAGGVPGVGAGVTDAGTECAGKYCLPFGSCHCWSDVYVYGAGLLLVLGGTLLVYRGAGE